MLKNEYKIVNGVIYFRLHNKKHGYFTCKVDEIHYDKLVSSGLKWHLGWSKTVKKYYAKATKYKGLKNGKPQYETILMHRFLTDCENGMSVDHINHDTLDNRDCNIEVVTIEENNKRRQNRANKNSTTGVRNITYCKAADVYIVQFYFEGKNIQMGRFETLEEAKDYADRNRHKYYTNVS